MEECEVAAVSVVVLAAVEVQVAAGHCLAVRVFRHSLVVSTMM